MPPVLLTLAGSGAAKLLRRYWQPALILVLAGALGAGAAAWWRDRDARLRREGVLAERAAAAESTLAVLRPQLQQQGAAIIRDTAVIKQLVTRIVRDTAWRHDTVYVAGDSTPRIATPPAVLARYDTLQRSCSALADSAGAFRTTCERTIAALQQQLRAAAAGVQPVNVGVGGSCRAEFWKGFAWGAGSGGLAGGAIGYQVRMRVGGSR